MSDFNDWDRFIGKCKNGKTLMNEAFDLLSIEFLENIQLGTPVDTGNLQAQWAEGHANVDAYVKSVPKKKTKDTFERTFENDTPYGYPLNYGWDQEVGRFVPAINAQLVRDHIDGRYFLEKTVDSMDLKGDLYKTLLKDYWEE